MSSVPLVYLGEALSNIGSHLIDDLEDHWSFGAHAKEQLEMIRLLREWKQAVPTRELLVLRGDVHVGGRSTIHHHDEPIFEQLITSPITTKPPPGYQLLGLKLLLEAEERIGPSYAVEHSGITNRRNFGIVLARAPANTHAHLAGSLFTES